jgi:hypothetical protein
MRFHSRLAVAALSLALGTTGCRDEATVADPVPPIDQVLPYVAGDAARDIADDGRFDLPPAAPPSHVPIITPERAREIAMADIRSFGRFFVQSWEKKRGEPIHLESLHAEERVVFARTPYGVFPDGFHPAFRRYHGPHYLVTLSDGRNPILVAAVAAYGTDVGINEKGLFAPRLDTGGEVEIAVLPRDTGRWDFAGPERAVERMGRRVGARVTRTPELVWMGRPYHPYWVAWKMSLDRGVAVRSTRNGRRLSTRELYVGPGRRILVPAESQPPFIEVGGDRGDFRRPERVQLPVLPGETGVFEEVVPEGGER